MSIQRVVGVFLAGFPLLASGQTLTADVQAMQGRQQELETQVREQNARSQDLERTLHEARFG